MNITYRDKGLTCIVTKDIGIDFDRDLGRVKLVVKGEVADSFTVDTSTYTVVDFIDYIQTIVQNLK